MRHLHVLAVLLCVGAGACSQSPPEPLQTAAADAARLSDLDAVTMQTSPEERAGNVAGDLNVAAPVRHENLTVFPVVSRTPRDADTYITLEEGLQAGTVEIREVGADAVEGPVPNGEESETAQVGVPAEPVLDDSLQLNNGPSNGNEVNRLLVFNRSDRPLYLMPGEVIVGGSQDRAIADELVLAPSGEPVSVSVYCVEHGRWGSRSDEESTQLLAAVAGSTVQADEFAMKAREGKFAVSAGYLNKPTRLAAQSGDGQQAVWNEVEKANAQSNVLSPTMSFSVNYADENVGDALEPYLEALTRPVAEQEQVVGVIIAINGKIESVDVFGSTPLFNKLWPKLLKSHALDALHAADAVEADRLSTVSDATAFLNEVMQAQVEKTSEQQDGLVVTKRNSDRVVSFVAGSADASVEDAAAAFGGAVHAAGYAK